MRKAPLFAAITVLACLPAAAMAGYSSNPSRANTRSGSASQTYSNPLVQVNNRLTLGATGTYQYFTTHMAGGHPGRDIGWMPGVHAGASLMSSSYGIKHLFAQVSGDYIAGDTHNSSAGGTTTNHLGRYQIKLGKGMMLNRKLMVTPYATFGERFWDRKLQTSGVSNHQYYQNMFAGGGFKVDYMLTRRLTLTGDAMGASTIDPKMHTASAPKHHYQLDSRAMARAKLGADYKIHGPWHAYADVSYTYLAYGGHSAEHSTAYEPSSYTHDVTIGTGLRYDF